jgi:glycosyltransferase involved in cell wall biosynthesis
MKLPLVSILIPCYNAERFLAETLKSALAQTWENIEVIVVDDGSSDNSLAVAKSFESPVVKVISQENQGQSASENRALAEAQGDFITYLDADDLLSPDKTELQVRVLGDATSEFVASGEWGRFFITPADAVFNPQPLWTDHTPVDWLVLAFENNLMMHGASWLISRRIIEQAGPWNEKLSLINDFDYFSRVLLASKGIKFCSGARSFYRSGIENSLSASKSRSAWESAFLSLTIGTGNLLATEDTPRTRYACATVFQRFIYEVYPDVRDLQKIAATKVQVFGGSNLLPSGGERFRQLSRLIGWKLAKRFQRRISSRDSISPLQHSNIGV